MQSEPDLDFRYNATSGITPILLGAILCGGCVFVLISGPTAQAIHSAEGVGGLAIVALFLAGGAFMVRFGLKRVFDRSVVLSLTAEGIKDSRTGLFVGWRDFRGIRLWVKTTNGSLSKATMFIKVPKANGYGEVSFSLEDLDQPYEQVADLVHRRGLAAC